MTRRQLGREMDVVEFREWMGFYLLEPFGDEWRQTARTCQVAGSAFGGKLKESDFMPTEMSKDTGEQSSDEMEQLLRANLSGLPHG